MRLLPVTYTGLQWTMIAVYNFFCGQQKIQSCLFIIYMQTIYSLQTTVSIATLPVWVYVAIVEYQDQIKKIPCKVNKLPKENHRIISALFNWKGNRKVLLVSLNYVKKISFALKDTHSDGKIKRVCSSFFIARFLEDTGKNLICECGILRN